MKIFIRTDGGNGIGFGHVMRMLSLANVFRKNNNKVIFLCQNKEEYKEGIKEIVKKGYKIYKLNSNDIIADIIKFQKYNEADMLITDSYEVDEYYFKRLKHYFKFTGYIDDINKCRMDVDFLVNQNANARELNYYINVMPYTKLLLGLDYCMIRDEFRKNYVDKKEVEFCSDVLLTLGGTDDKYNTLKILNMIIKYNINIHVVITDAFDKELEKEILKLSYKHKNVILYKNPEISKLMAKCQVAVSGCGSTLYELCAMEVPNIGIIVADNQREVGNYLKKEGLVLEIFEIDEFSENEFHDKFKKLISNKSIYRNKILNKQKQQNLLNGCENLYREIVNICMYN